MSNQVVNTRPQNGSWSEPVFQEEARRLHEHYSRFCLGLPKKRLVAISYLAHHIFDSDAPLSDGYIPALMIALKVKAGKIALVFPKFGGYVDEDGSNTERSLTIHSVGEVEREAVEAIVELFISHLPPSVENPGRLMRPEEAEWSPCGFVDRATA